MAGSSGRSWPEADRGRRYSQRCGVALALDVVGGRWTLLLVRDLLLGPRRFGDLLAGLPGLTPNLLSDRLRSLQAHGVVVRTKLPPPSGATVYELTERGRALEHVVLALGAFGEEYLRAPESSALHADLRWLMVSLKRRYRGGAPPAVIEIVSGDKAFSVTLERESIDVRDGSPARPNVRIEGEEQPIAGLLLGMLPVRSAAGAGVSIEGDKWVVHALVDAVAPL